MPPSVFTPVSTSVLFPLVFSSFSSNSRLESLSRTSRFSSSAIRRTSVSILLRPRAARRNTRSPSFSVKKKRILPSVSEDAEEEEEDDEDVAAAEYESGMSEGDSYGEDEEDEEEDEEEEEAESSSGAEAMNDARAGFEKHKWQRVARLLKDAKEFGDGIIDYQELAGVYDFPIDVFQQLAIEAFLGGSSVVVSAPTSSGKTLIAEAAALATVCKGRRIFYTTPLKALSNQKFREFRDTFGESFVGLLTGDSAVNRDAQILIMTTEILRNMLYQSVGVVSSWSKLFQVDTIVLDEVHYLSDISRGTVWEEIVIYCPKEVQLLCLSATVANPDELAGWIDQIHGTTEVVTARKRPVPLRWHFSLKNSLVPLLNKNGTKMNRKLSLDHLQASNSEVDYIKENGSRGRNSRKSRSDRKSKSITNISKRTALSKNNLSTFRRSQVPQVRDTLRHLRARNMLPAIWFIFSRKGCDAAVQYLETCNLLDEFEVCEVELALKRFKDQYPDAVRDSSVQGLLHGIAAHHAGCLPLWKSFIEELFQQGLLKVIFATETLAAGINMPARTTVISSLSKRTQSGRTLLSSNELQQMAGRAGRRGIDTEGHVVLIQTPYEGAEESCEILFSGLEPLVSQFKASYGMVLNLLSGEKITNRMMEVQETKAVHSGRTLEEARKLVEQSFGNYVGSNVMLAAKEELKKIEEEVEFLSMEVTDDAIDGKCRELLSEVEYSEISRLQEELRAEKRQRTALRQKMELKRMVGWKPILEECENGQMPFICLQYKDQDGVQHFVPAVYIMKLESLSIPQVTNLVNLDYADKGIIRKKYDLDVVDDIDSKPTYYISLGSDNSWYVFNEKWLKMVYRTGLPDVPLVQGDALPRQALRELLLKENLQQWEKLAESEFGGLWCIEGSLETWSWSLNIPVLNSLSEEDEVEQWSQSYQDAVGCYREQRSKVSRLKKTIVNTKGFKQFKKVIDASNFKKEKIKRLEARSNRLIRRIEQIEPSGWKEFLQIGNVIHEARALDINMHIKFPLGETAAAIRGENELWIAMVLRNKVLLDLKPAQLAAVVGSLVSEGIKIRPWKSNSYIYEPSSTVLRVLESLEEQRTSLFQLQDKHGVKISCDLDVQFSGMVEAWASGLTWREIMMDCAMDEGDLARLLRRTIDLLAQVPKLPDIDKLLQNNAKAASSVMDRSPISELSG